MSDNTYSMSCGVTRVLAMFCAMVVSACITAKGYERFYSFNLDLGYHKACIFKDMDSTCSYGSIVGWVTDGYLLLFLLVDYWVYREKPTDDLGNLFLLDTGLSLAWTLLWFASFVTFAATKVNSIHDSFDKKFHFSRHAINNANTAITFSAFTTLFFVVLTAVSWGRFVAESGRVAYVRELKRERSRSYTEPSEPESNQQTATEDDQITDTNSQGSDSAGERSDPDEQVTGRDGGRVRSFKGLHIRAQGHGRRHDLYYAEVSGRNHKYKVLHGRVQSHHAVAGYGALAVSPIGHADD